MPNTQFVLVVAENHGAAQEICKVVSPEYTPVISSPLELHDYAGNPSVLLLDLEVTKQYYSDPLISYLSRSSVPVILLSSQGDSMGVIEAMDKLGSYSYVVRDEYYGHILNRLIKKTIEQSLETGRLHRAVIGLKKRVDELEGRPAKSGDEQPKSEPKVDLLEEILFVFKRGEIHLPSHPKLSQKFGELIKKGAGLPEIAYLLKQDAAVTSKLISISNSPYYRGISNNQTLEQALNRLGLKTTKQYVEMIVHRALFTTKEQRFREIMEALWTHSLSCAYASQIITETLNISLPDDPFTLGLLHDIGKLVLLQTIVELQKVNKIGAMIDNTEIISTLERYHGRFGKSLLTLWKFSRGYLEIAANHDDLKKANPPSGSLLVVHLANLVAKSLGYCLGEQVEINLEGAQSFRLLGMKKEAAGNVSNRVKWHMEESKKYFS